MSKRTGSQIVSVQVLADRSVKLVTRKATGELHEEQYECRAGRGGWSKDRLVSMIRHADPRFRGAKIQRFNKNSLCQLLGLLLENHESVAPEVRPDRKALAPEVRPDRKSLAPGVRPDRKSLAPALRNIVTRLKELRDHLALSKQVVEQHDVKTLSVNFNQQLEAYVKAQRMVRLKGETQSLWWAERLERKHTFVSFVQKAVLPDDIKGTPYLPAPERGDQAVGVRTAVTASYIAGGADGQVFILFTVEGEQSVVLLANIKIKKMGGRISERERKIHLGQEYEVHLRCFEALYESMASSSILVPYQFVAFSPYEYRLYTEPARFTLYNLLRRMVVDRWLESQDTTAANEVTEFLRVVILRVCHTLHALSVLPQTKSFYHFDLHIGNVFLVESPTVHAERFEFPQFGLSYEVPPQSLVTCIADFSRAYLPRHPNMMELFPEFQMHVGAFRQNPDNFWDLYYFCHSLLLFIRKMREKFNTRGRGVEFDEGLREVKDFLSAVVPREAFRAVYSSMSTGHTFIVPEWMVNQIIPEREWGDQPPVLFHHRLLKNRDRPFPEKWMKAGEVPISAQTLQDEEKKLWTWYLENHRNAIRKMLEHSFFRPFTQRQHQVGNVWVGVPV